MKIIPTILCGGSGTRLWPTSRTYAPKQLQKLVGNKSLLADTVLRLQSHPDCISPVLICGEPYADEIEQQMSDEGADLSAIITEPMGRDTAAAAAIAAYWGEKLKTKDPNEDYVVLVLPADHHISNLPRFHQALRDAASAALKGFISTIGITPSAPETGFGYIKYIQLPLDGLNSYSVVRFVEKPDEETAKSYIASNNYLWNSGMFAFSSCLFLEELKSYAPEIAEKSKQAFDDATLTIRSGKPLRLALNASSFIRVPSTSIDYAVMERTKKASVHPSEFGWNDVGSWSAAYEIATPDENGNVLTGDVVSIDTKNSLVQSYDRVIAAIDLDNMIIVDTADAILICPKTSVQKVKTVHKNLTSLNHPAALHHGSGSTAYAKQIKTKARDWLFNSALPFWTENGLDRTNGGAFEAVSFSGEPFGYLPKRVRVQARQTYVFAHSHLLGHEGALEAMRVPLEFMLKYGQIEKGRYAHILAPDGSMLDKRNDSYDHAFVLYSLAWAYKATGDKTILQASEDAMDFVHANLRHDLLGFVEQLPVDGRLRRANPHMHLFEAAQAWMVLNNHSRMADMASEIFDLFNSHFCVGGLLREYFNDDLIISDDLITFQDIAVEPGHLIEWAYLLRKYEGITGKACDSIATMEAFSDVYGLCPETGLVIDQTFANGRYPKNISSRLWPQTEYIRLKFTKGGSKNIISAYEMLDKVINIYLTFNGNTPGYWIDQVDRSGNIIGDKAPASSFYHILGALSYLI